MKEITVTIEETVSQEFKIKVPDDVDVDKYIREAYKDQKLVVDNANLISASYMIEEDDGSCTSWVEI